MTRRIFSLLLIGLGAASVLRALNLARNPLGILHAFAAQGNSGNTPKYHNGVLLNPGRNLDADAASAWPSGDPVAVGTLVDDVFAHPHSFPRLPPGLEGPVKQRIVAAEVAYRHGQRGGVNTADLVNTFNGLADKFGLPDYAKTSVAQVRYLRVGLARAAPKFMGNGLYRPGAKVGDTVSDTMSPAQAVHTALMLADQKLFNPDYQVPPDKWDPRISVFPPQSRVQRGTLIPLPGTKDTEIRQRLGLPPFAAPEGPASTLSLGDVPGLLDQALTGLGIGARGAAQ